MESIDLMMSVCSKLRIYLSFTFFLVIQQDINSVKVVRLYFQDYCQGKWQLNLILSDVLYNEIKQFTTST